LKHRLMRNGDLRSAYKWALVLIDGLFLKLLFISSNTSMVIVFVSSIWLCVRDWSFMGHRLASAECQTCDVATPMLVIHIGLASHRTTMMTVRRSKK
jgi:hypothetical protein